MESLYPDPLYERSKGLTLTGFKYPLDHYDFKGFCSLGVSNEIIAESAEIAFEEGILIVIEARD